MSRPDSDSSESVNFIEKPDLNQDFLNVSGLVWWLWHSKDLWNEFCCPILAQIHSKSQIFPILVALKRRYHIRKTLKRFVRPILPYIIINIHPMSPTYSESTNPEFVFTKSFSFLLFCIVYMNKKIVKQIRICRFRIGCWHLMNKIIGKGQCSNHSFWKTAIITSSK